MHLCILDADTIPQALSAKFGQYSDMLMTLLDKTPANFRYTVIKLGNQPLPREVNRFDAYLITGSKKSVYEEITWIQELKRFVTHAEKENKKFVGICFGHQLLAAALGGCVEKSEKGWGIGVASFDVHQVQVWQQPKLDSFSLLVSHQDQVIRLPSGAKLIAGSDFCPNACFQKGENILGIQGHPEFSRGYLRALLETRKGRIGEECIRKVEQNMRKDVNEYEVGRWIFNFLKH